ncbi:MAG: hypothetical protein QM639_13135 [Rhodocyclaceae bacterium]
MRTSTRQGGQVLIIILVTTLLIGGSVGLMAGGGIGGRPVGELRDDVAHIVTDPARRDQIGAVLDEAEAEGKRINRQHAAAAKEWLQLLERHDAAQADFDALADRLEADNRPGRAALIGLRYRLRALMTEAEWQQLFPAPQAPPALAGS